MQALRRRLLLHSQKAAAVPHSQRLISASGDARLNPGHSLTAERVFSQEEVLQFVQLTGDANPIHTAAFEAAGTTAGAAAAVGHAVGAAADPAASQPTAAGLQHAIVPGMLMASMFPALIGSAFPGALYLSQDLSFRRTAHVGDHIRAEVAVARRSGSRVVYDTKCILLPSMQVLVDGKALALIRMAKAT